MLVRFWGVSLEYEGRETTFLTETDGRVINYSRNGVPEALSNPLKMNDRGLEAKMSGSRSALVKIGKNWYKLKGCNPQPGLFSGSDRLPKLKGTLLDIVDPTMKPKGSMCIKSAASELEEQLKIIKKLEEFNLPAPLYPVARFDYDMENRACAVSITKGDLRLSELVINFSETSYVIPDYKNQFDLIYQWLGFAQHITKQTFGRLGKTSNGIQNYIFYNIPDGYGLMRTDFAHRPDDEKILKPDFFGNLEQHVVEYLTQHKYSDRVILKVLETLEIETRQSKKAVAKSMKGYVVNMPGYYLPSTEKMMAFFHKGLEGEQPKPISKKFIEFVF